MVPKESGVCELIYQVAHDLLGHFGFFNSYDNIWELYFWPSMRNDLEEKYIPGCEDCQQFKSGTSKPCGPLHPLPVPDGQCESIAMDFIGPLPEDNGINYILTITN